MFTALMLVSGLFWTLTYVLIIRRGFLDKTYGMPLAALCANLSWEFVFSFVYPHGPTQRPVDIVWFCLDLVILFQLLRYCPREFADLPKSIFYAMFALALATGFFTVLFVTLEFGDRDGAYSAFGQNLLMSVLFVTMVYARRSLRGQSLAIALFKMAGTAVASLAFFFYNLDYRASLLLPFLFVAILVFDAIYAAAVYTLRKAERADAYSEQPASKPVARMTHRTDE